VVGNGRGYLALLVTGSVDSKTVQAALDAVNSELPHYRQIRNFTILKEALTPESGLLTAMGKIKRDAINTKFRDEIDRMYREQSAAVGVSG
jgi:long-chain acyl-CoA synthetase